MTSSTTDAPYDLAVVERLASHRAPYLIVIPGFAHRVRAGIRKRLDVLEKGIGSLKIRDVCAPEIAAHFLALPLTHETRIHKRGVQTWPVGAMCQDKGHGGVYTP